MPFKPEKSDPMMYGVVEDTIKIKHSASYHWCADPCNVEKRKYFWVLENGLESNSPAVCSIFGIPLLPSNCICPGTDLIWKTYYNKGIFSEHGFPRKIGCIKGPPTLYDGEFTYVCCCMDCPSCVNKCIAGTCCMGSMLALSPYETHCCCIPNKHNWCSNCCGLCGFKDGVPCLKFPLIWCLADGEATIIQEKAFVARNEWRARFGLAPAAPISAQPMAYDKVDAKA